MLKNSAALIVLRWSALALVLQGCNVNGSTPKAVIDDDSVTEQKMADNAISARTIRNGAVLTTHIADQNVTSGKLATGINVTGGSSTWTGTLGVTGATTLSSTLALTGDFNVNGGKFIVLGASGNTTVAANFTVGTVLAAEKVTTLSGATTINSTTQAGPVGGDGTQPLTVQRSDNTVYTGGFTHKAGSSTFTVNPTNDSNTDNFIGLQGVADLTTTQTTGTLTGLQGKANVTAGGAGAIATTAIGVHSLLNFNSTGTMANAMGFRTAIAYGAGPGVVTTRYIGLYIENPANGAGNTVLQGGGALYGVVADGATTLNFFAGKTGLGAGNTNPSATLDVRGHIASSGTAPAVSGCGTAPVVNTATDTRGKVTMGTANAASCTLTFNTAYTTAPICTVSLLNSTALGVAVGTTTTTLTITISAATDSIQFAYICMQ